MLNSDKYEILASIGMVIMMIAISVMIAMMMQACTLTEINIVQRATVSKGDGTSSMQHDATAKHEEDSMKLIVPFK